MLLCVNNDGSDSHILIVVGKSSEPLNTQKNFLHSTMQKKKSWMTMAIFMDFSRALGASMVVQGGNISLLVDNSAPH